MLYFHPVMLAAMVILPFTLCVFYIASDKHKNKPVSLVYFGLFILALYYVLGAAASQSFVDNQTAQASKDLLDGQDGMLPSTFMAPQWFHSGLMYVGSAVFIFGLFLAKVYRPNRGKPTKSKAAPKQGSDDSILAGLGDI